MNTQLTHSTTASPQLGTAHNYLWRQLRDHGTLIGGGVSGVAMLLYCPSSAFWSATVIPFLWTYGVMVGDLIGLTVAFLALLSTFKDSYQ